MIGGRSFPFLLASISGLSLFRAEVIGQETIQPSVRFTVEVDYVEVYAIVTNEDGVFVSGLGREDFEILEDGNLQKIAHLTPFNSESDMPQPLPFEAEIVPDVVSNEQTSEGRVYIFLLDDLHTPAMHTHRVRRAARDFIDHRLLPNDIAAVVHTSGKSDAGQGFTSNRTLLEEAVDKFHGRKLRSSYLERYDPGVRSYSSRSNRVSITESTQLQRLHRVGEMYESLENLSRALIGIRGRRKAIVFFSEGHDFSIFNAAGKHTHHIIDRMSRAVAAATRANVTIYAVDPRGLAHGAEDFITVPGVSNDYIMRRSIIRELQGQMSVNHDGLRVISEDTGGFAIINQNDFTTGYERIVEENSRYYLLGYYPTNANRDGTYREIDVRVKRPGVRVKARNGYIAAGENDKKTKPDSIDAPDGLSPALHRILQSPLPLPEIPMRAVAPAFRADKKKALIPLVVEMSTGPFTFTERDGRLHDIVEFLVVAVDKRGKIRASAHRNIELSLEPETHQKMWRNGLRVMSTLELSSGQYQIRVVAYEGGGARSGSLFYDIAVPDYSDTDLVITPLVVTSVTENSVPVIGFEESKQRIPFLPSTRRDFSRSDTLLVLAEIYSHNCRRAELPCVVVDCSLRTVDGTTVHQLGERLGMVHTDSGKGIIFRDEVALSDLTPGHYVLAVTAREIAGDREASREASLKIY